MATQKPSSASLSGPRPIRRLLFSGSVFILLASRTYVLTFSAVLKTANPSNNLKLGVFAISKSQLKTLSVKKVITLVVEIMFPALLTMDYTSDSFESDAHWPFLNEIVQKI
jgi:hypothetical protein